jgi:hypothetical protein
MLEYFKKKNFCLALESPAFVESIEQNMSDLVAIR